MNSYRLAVCSIQNYDPLHESPVKPQLYNAPHESPVEPLQSEEVPESWAKWCRKRINAYTHGFPLYTSGGINDARSQSTCLKIEVEGLAECGGMCDIYRGTAILNDGSKVKVAAKVFRQGSNQSQEDKDAIERRLEREARVWKGLEHANILKFLGQIKIVSGGNERPALVSPWMNNGNIGQYLKPPGRSENIRLKLELLIQVVNGLEYLHSKEVIHADLKGNNILIDDEGKARICDFGRAYQGSLDDCSKNLIASALWMAPEIFLYDPPQGPDSEVQYPITKHSDMWSLGITALEIFDGKESLWKGTRSIARITSWITRQGGPHLEIADYPSISKVPRLWECLEKCWVVEERSRPSAADVYNDLLPLRSEVLP